MMTLLWQLFKIIVYLAVNSDLTVKFCQNLTPVRLPGIQNLTFPAEFARASFRATTANFTSFFRLQKFLLSSA